MDYANVTRPIFYSMGLNGPLQQINLLSNLFGFDNEERRISNQIGNRHKLRAGIHLSRNREPTNGGGGIGKPDLVLQLDVWREQLRQMTTKGSMLHIRKQSKHLSTGGRRPRGHGNQSI